MLPVKISGDSKHSNKYSQIKIEPPRNYFINYWLKSLVTQPSLLSASF